jgi:hypothetical protein
MSVVALSLLSTTATPFSADPTPLVAQNDSSGPSLTVMIMVVAAVLLLLAVFGGARSTVVVVENPGRSFGNFLGILTIVVALGILYFAYLAPGRGSA